MNEPDIHEATRRVEPVPPRFRWLKRFFILGAFLVAGLGCLRWWWGCEADRRLAAQIERYRLAEEPVYAYEFDEELDAVEKLQNAAILLEQAMGGITATTDSGVHFTTFTDDPGAFGTNMAAAVELMQSNAEVLAPPRISVCNLTLDHYRRCFIQFLCTGQAQSSD